ncbi:hypothetical protein WA026_023566 [Henosepilachna vigintioctopunctata]|uniref:Phorbol-ester/DAG-type domain-containing protein n=1 Tax=Henosepilachna vigintioctopunctata TaxID=420089 RepID=A0AAW1VCF3_9CUCU
MAASVSDGGVDPRSSLIAQYDDIIQYTRTLQEQYLDMESSYIKFVQNSLVLYNNFQKSHEECLRLRERLDLMDRDTEDMEKKLTFARTLLDQEKNNRKALERERDNLEIQIALVKELFLRDENIRRAIPDDILKKLDFMDTVRIDDEEAPHSSCPAEVNTTGSILSNFSYSKSEDDLNISSRLIWKKHHPTGVAPEQAATTNRRSCGNKLVEIRTNGTVRATTTLTMPENGPITTTSVIEAIPLSPSAPISNACASSAPPPDKPQNEESRARSDEPPKQVATKSRQDSINDFGYGQKEHVLQLKLIIMPNNCDVCQKKITFSKSSWKCKECKKVCHVYCKDQLLSNPCSSLFNTPNQGNDMGINEIE